MQVTITLNKSEIDDAVKQYVRKRMSIRTICSVQYTTSDVSASVVAITQDEQNEEAPSILENVMHER